MQPGVPKRTQDTLQGPIKSHRNPFLPARTLKSHCTLEKNFFVSRFRLKYVQDSERCGNSRSSACTVYYFKTLFTNAQWLAWAQRGELYSLTRRGCYGNTLSLLYAAQRPATSQLQTGSGGRVCVLNFCGVWENTDFNWFNKVINDNTAQEEHLPTTLPVPIPHKVYATHRERAAPPDSRDGASSRTAPQASTNGNAKPPTTLAAGPCSSPQNAASRSRRLDSSGR